MGETVADVDIVTRQDAVNVLDDSESDGSDSGESEDEDGGGEEADAIQSSIRDSHA